MVLVVGVSAFDGHLENLANDASKVDGFLLTVLNLVTQVREKFAVEELAHTSLAVFFLLACSEFLFQPLVAFFGGDDLVLLVVVHFVDVGHDVLERVRVSCNGLEDVLVVFNTEGTHEQNHGDSGGAGGADLDHQHPVSALLDGQRFAHTVFLGENLGHFSLLRIALVDFDGHSVRGEVFHGDENTLSAVDDEITTGVEGVFALLAEELMPGGFVLGGGGG